MSTTTGYQCSPLLRSNAITTIFGAESALFFLLIFSVLVFDPALLRK